jgi:hypothetical protein
MESQIHLFNYGNGETVIGSTAKSHGTFMNIQDFFFVVVRSFYSARKYLCSTGHHNLPSTYCKGLRCLLQ